MDSAQKRQRQLDNEPGYFAVIPAAVRYDARLKGNEKMLYGEISALARRYGFAWASNAHFMQTFGASRRTVQRWLRNLSRAGHVRCEIEKKDGNGRRIWINQAVAPLASKMTLPSVKCGATPSVKNDTRNSIKKNSTTNMHANDWIFAPIPYFKSREKREAYVNRLNTEKAKRCRQIGDKDPEHDPVIRRLNGKLRAML